MLHIFFSLMFFSLPKIAWTAETETFADISFTWIPAGCFQMGSPESEAGRFTDEGPRHMVCLDGFWIETTELTQKEWSTHMGSNPAYFQKGDTYPVEQVSWNDTQLFIEKLNRLGTTRFRLPTEAEWEYAARAGSTEPFSFGETIHALTEANFNGVFYYGDGPEEGFYGSTLPVGSLPANRFGLFDMHGNVLEWVADWYDAEFYKRPEASQKNPQCQENSSSYRVVRGGYWNSDGTQLRSAYRDWDAPQHRGNHNGFRLVALPKP
ncbi:MAG: formylglycine-generating enzyme family protein [Magnetococcus sp. DMHC-6]